MQILELFSGTASFSKVGEKYFGYSILTVDKDKYFKPDICMDSMKIKKIQVYLGVCLVCILISMTIYPISEYNWESNTVHHYINDEFKLFIYQVMTGVIYLIVVILFFKTLFEG